MIFSSANVQFTDSFWNLNLIPNTKSGIAADIEIQKQKILVNVAQQSLSVEKAKLLPSFWVGYTNQSFSGYQNLNGVDQYFTPSNRFNSVQISLSAPLFFNGQRKKINLSKIEYDIAQNQLESKEFEFNQQKKLSELQLLNLEKVYKNQKPIFEKQITDYKKLAEQKINNGEINAIEWSRLHEQALNIALSLAEIQLNYQFSIINNQQYHEK